MTLAAIEGKYAEPFDQRLRSYGDDRVLLIPPYTEQGRETGWALISKP